ncbi:hypothetical protein LQZ18_13560 [Lachnospiraceae bacterium ZAX-1]
MELDKKLEAFHESAIEAANQQSSQKLEKYKSTHDKNWEEFLQTKQNEIEEQYREEEVKIKKEVNRKVSEQLIEQKRILREHQRGKKIALFEQINRVVDQFMATEDYVLFLIAEIKKARDFAADQELILYLNPTDRHLKDRLEKETGVVLHISEQDFRGGIRGVIHSKNVLIDESFSTKLAQGRKEYTVA